MGPRSTNRSISAGLEVSTERIEQVEREMVAAAVRAKAAGLDCVNLAYANGGISFHCSFISPFFNRRTDEYGGDWEGRLRLPVRTVKKIREAVGEDYPILTRICSDEFVGEMGITIADTTNIIVPALENAGVDCFDVSQGSITHCPTECNRIHSHHSKGCFIHLAAAVKRATRV